MLKKFKRKRDDFTELHLPTMRLRKKHLTDAEVAVLQEKDPYHFNKYFEEIQATEDAPTKKGKNKKSQEDSEPTT